MAGRALLVALAVPALLPGAALAAVTVTTAKDETIAGDGTCSLREAVAAANGLASPDCPGAASGTTTIALPAGDYRLSLGSELELFGPTAIVGAGASSTTIDAEHHARVLEVDSGTTVAVSGATLTGGRTGDGSRGADATVSGATGAGGGSALAGGGVDNHGALTLTDVVITGNATGSGGRGGAGFECSVGICSPGPGGAGGDGGSGGALANDGTATLSRVTISGNRTGDGGAGGIGGGAGASAGVGGAGGRAGSGAGIYNVGTLAVAGSAVAGNTTGIGGAGGGGGSFFDIGGTGGRGGDGGTAGDGGGIATSAIAADSVTITDSTITGNATGGGGLGGSGGQSFSGNSGSGAAGGHGGNGGAGAAFFTAGSPGEPVLLSNVTITANATGDGGYGGDGGDGFGAGSTGAAGGAGGDGGFGAGIDSAGGLVTVSQATIASGATGGGGRGGDPGAGRSGASQGTTAGSGGAAGRGGGLALAGAGPGIALTERNSLVASNAGGNCTGPVTDGGHDLSFPDASCPHAVTGDPRLGALASNGGPAQTLALQAGSAAIDQVPSVGAGCPASDERGVSRPRPAGGACDIGAYEYSPPECRSLTATTAPARPVRIQLSCSEPSGVALTYVIDQRPSHGSLGSLDGPAVTYTPSATFGGTDSFRYHASNSNGTAPVQTVTISVPRVPPAISRLRLTHRRFRVGKGKTAVLAAGRRAPARRAAATGTRFQFTLSAAARVQITIVRTRRPKLRTKTIGTLVRRSQPKGPVTIAFSGRLGKRALAPGTYKATLIASNISGQSRVVSVTFTIVRR